MTVSPWQGAGLEFLPNDLPTPSQCPIDRRTLGPEEGAHITIYSGQLKLHMKNAHWAMCSVSQIGFMKFFMIFIGLEPVIRG
jgi:hypothetical protein